MSNNWLEKFDALNTREQWMIIATCFVALWGMWDALFNSPLESEREQLKKQLVDSKTQLIAQQQALVQLESSTINNPNLIKQKQLESLKKLYQELQVQMGLLGKNFVPPELMAKALNDLLAQQHQLSLISLETLPVVPLIESKQEQMIYQHGLELHFSGEYLATVNYLKSLEESPWHFVWDSIDYKVQDYPMAEITLRVYTINTEKDWLHV